MPRSPTRDTVVTAALESRQILPAENRRALFEEVSAAMGLDEVAMPFAERVPVADDAPAIDRLVAVAQRLDDVHLEITANAGHSQNEPPNLEALVRGPRFHQEVLAGEEVTVRTQRVGVMGSKRRWAATRERLVESGVPADEIDRVHVPIGMNIGAETVEEIVQEMLLTTTSERQGRVIDHDAAASMEEKKKDGYF